MSNNTKKTNSNTKNTNKLLEKAEQNNKKNAKNTNNNKKNANNSKKNTMTNKTVNKVANSVNSRNPDVITPNEWVLTDRKDFPDWIPKTFVKYRLSSNVKNANVKKNNDKFELLPYQKFLRDYMQESSPYRGVLIYHGLGSGKCVAPETQIIINGLHDSIEKAWSVLNAEGYHGVVDAQNPNTEWLHIQTRGLITKSFDSDRGVLVEKPINKMYRQHVNEPLRYVRLANGMSIICTLQHRLWVNRNGVNQWVNNIELGDLMWHNSPNSTVLMTSPVTEFFYRDYNGWVYDLEVLETHSYLANGIVSHNTCSAIGIAENLKTKRNIVVMLPASLRDNFIKELQFCGSETYAKNPDLIKNKYSFVSYRAPNTVDQLEAIGSLDDHVIIVDEVHNLISMIIGSGKTGKVVYEKLMNAKNVKLIFLSGTPIINYPFEAGVMFNMLRGFMEVITFKITEMDTKRYQNVWKLEELERALARDIKEVDFVESNARTKFLSIKLTVPHYDKKFNDVLAKVATETKKYGIAIAYAGMQQYLPYPDEDKVFHDYFIQETQLESRLVRTDLFKRRMIGLVSYYKGASQKYYPKVEGENDFLEVPMSDYQYQEYQLIRQEEKKTEKTGQSRVLSTKATSSENLQKVSSIFRIYTREACNFVFPSDIPRPYLSIKISRSGNGNGNGNNNKFSEKALTKNNKNNETDKDRMTEASVVGLSDSPGAIKGQKQKAYQQRIERALGDLAIEAKTYLSPGPDGLGRYSPKMDLMLANVKKSPGSVLVYSNFRNMEGVQIFGMVLEANGFVPFLASQSVNASKGTKKAPIQNGGKNANNNKKALAKNKNGKKYTYAIWSGKEDKETRKELLRIFNSKENMYGDIIRVLMITAAGAEGIDLKNVRQVHIMEPYWNEIRTDQVIGRAVRMNSHAMLPVADRNVHIYRYVSVFTEQQRDESREKMTTDQYIQDMALRKKMINSRILRLMKEAAVDCRLNKADNNSDIDCLAFGDGAEGLSYVPDLAQNATREVSTNEVRNVKRDIIMAFVNTADRNKIVMRFHQPTGKLYSIMDKTYTNPLFDINKINNSTKKSLAKIGVDMGTGTIYDYEASKAGSAIKIGRVGPRGEFIKE